MKRLATSVLAGSLGMAIGAGAGSLSASAKSTTKPVQAASVASERTSGTATVFASVLNIRKGPGAQFADIGNLYKNQRVTLLARTTKAYAVNGYQGAFRWYQVRAPSGAVGWSWGGFLKVGGQTPPERKPGGGHPTPAAPVVAKKPVVAFNDVGTIFATSLHVRADATPSARILGDVTKGKVVKLTARTKFAYAISGYSGAYRWYRVQTGNLVGWSWGGFITVGKQPPNRNPGGGQQCDPKDPGCHSHTPPGGGPANNPPMQGPVASAGAAISVFPVAGKHWSWNKKACGYNDYYHGAGTNHANGHIGNDVFGVLGTRLVAPVDGVVLHAGYGGSVGGNRVTIRRGNWYFYHAHMNSVAVKVGQNIRAGQTIGTLGKTGSASGTEPHLHFSIYPSSNYDAGVNPFPFLQKVDGQCK